MRSMLQIARCQVIRAMKAIGDVQFAVTNDLLSPALQNTDALQSFANFLLDGTTSKLESVLKDSNGKEYHPADGDMLKKFEQLKADIYKLRRQGNSPVRVNSD